MSCFRIACVVVGLMGLGGGAAWGLELPAVFGDHMVLQRDMPVAVWGKGEPGSVVMVSFGPAVAQGGVKDDGTWRVDLPTLEASALGRSLQVVEATTDGVKSEKTFTDVLVGDVWHCSGQSNMSWQVSQSNNAAQEIAAADFPLIRHFTSPRVASPQPAFSSGGAWKVTSPKSIGGFSAVGFFFGRIIHQDIGVPVGLIDTSWGGAAAEAYVSEETLLAYDPTREETLAQRSKGAQPPMELSEEEKKKLRPQHYPYHLFNGMIHPVAPYTHKGVLWYQGETNAGRAAEYAPLMSKLMQDWRTLWDQPGDSARLPFLIVQLANFKEPRDTPPAHDGWADLRLAQTQVTKDDDHAWLATAIDIGQADDIHPTNKQEVGRRLALLALREVYGKQEVKAHGPTFDQLAFDPEQPGQVRVLFDHAKALSTTDKMPPRGFALRPKVGGDWVWADAALDAQDKNHVTLTAPAGIVGPFDVRYAYQVNPKDGPQGINLVNAVGLPALPFDTTWPAR